MRVGVSSYWFNRGQATVGRHLRSALDELGHETFVLARPAKETAAKPAHISHEDIWNQPGVTTASQYAIPLEEMLAWAHENAIEAVFFDQNYQFAEIAALRESGVRTLGRFVWEQFSAEHVEPARHAFDVIYSVIACEQERYSTLGVESPRVRWGIHPELLDPSLAAGHDDDTVRLFFPGGYMTKRKPLEPVIEAFTTTRDPRLRLILKAQVQKKIKRVRKLIGRDKRVEVIVDDLPYEEHMALFASSDVVLAPSRWEGLGLHLFEAMGLGIPVITNDNPPMNEVIADGENGLLVPGVELAERAPSGIPAFDPDVRALSAAIERVADPAELERLKAGAVASRERLSWANTLADLEALLEKVG